MTVQRSSLETIEEFLAHKRVAMVGVSRDARDFSVMLFNELVHRGYDMVPVNPRAAEVGGRPCFAAVQDVQPRVEAALLMTAPEVTESAVQDCAKAGIEWIWMYRAGGRGAVSSKAVEFCEKHGMRVVAGECPYMFLPNAGLHRLHGFIRKITGNYPRRAHA